MVWRELNVLLIAMAAAASPIADQSPHDNPPAPPRAQTRPASTSPAQSQPSTEEVVIAGEKFRLEIASDDSARDKGLMGRDHIDPNAGMLFIFPRPKELSFWMANCIIDIDILFLDAKGRIVATHKMKAEPPREAGESQDEYEARLKRYESKRLAQFAIELKAGTIERLKLRPGQAVAMEVERLKTLAAGSVVGPDAAAAPELRESSPGRIVAPPAVRLGNFAAAVSVKGDVAAMGAPFEVVGKRQSGSACVYKFVEGAWSQQALLTAPEASIDAQLGSSIAVGDNLVIAGAPGDRGVAEASGSAYAFRFKDGSWTQEARLVADDATEGDMFGSAVAIHGNNVVIGARGDNVAGMASGSAYVFQCTSGAWKQVAKLTASDAATGDQFGICVAVSGDVILIAAQPHRQIGVVSAALYAFRARDGTWGQEAILKPADMSSTSMFGSAIALDADRALVGDACDRKNGANSGAAYVFRFDGHTWTQETRLEPPHAAAQTFFGGSVALSGRTALIGSHMSNQAGEVHVYRFDDGKWTFQQSLAPLAKNAGAAFGQHISLDDEVALIAAPWEKQKGAAYVFRNDGAAWRPDRVLKQETPDEAPVKPSTAIFTSNGKGGGDWNDPNTWTPAGVPGSVHDYDAVRIVAGDKVIQKNRLAKTLGYYLLDKNAIHEFGPKADLAALSIDALGTWVVAADPVPVLAIRNASEVHVGMGIDVEIDRRYGAEYCDLLKNAPPPFDTLPPCTPEQLAPTAPLPEPTEEDLEFLRRAVNVQAADLAGLKRVTSLSFEGKQVADADLIHIANLRNVTVLNLSRTQISNAGVAYLKNCTGLVTLSLNQTRVTDACLAYLKDLPNLGWLDLSDTRTGDAGLAHVRNWKKMWSLSLRGTEVTDAGLQRLQPLADAESLGVSLDLSGTQVTDIGIRSLKDFRNINALDVSATGITDAGLPSLSKMSNMTRLSLRNTRISDAGLVNLRSLTNLERLDLHGTQINGSSLSDLTPLQSLTTLDLGGTGVGDAAIAHVIKLDHLWSLSLDSTAITDAGLAQLVSLKKLMSLEVSRTNITDDGLTQVAAIPNLNSVILRSTKVTAAGLANLKKAKPSLNVISN